ncbi:unnamed protein product [Rhizophagus irregularis]|nr:unnamed protein product [Rhizophagus irregularis]
MRAIFKNCSGLQKKISALLLRSPRPLEKKKSGRGSGRKSERKKPEGTIKKRFNASKRLSRRKRISSYELQILNLNLPKRPRFICKQRCFSVDLGELFLR